MTTPINPEDELPAAEPAPELEQGDRTDAERERDEYKEGWMRAKADLINHKRQEQERVGHALRAGMQGIVSDILLVLDSFGLAIATLQGDSAGEQGMRMIRSQLLEVLKRHGVEPIPPGELLGQDFDPGIAEAIGTQPSDQPEGTVVSVAQEGYRLHGTVLRPARVYLAATQ